MFCISHRGQGTSSISARVLALGCIIYLGIGWAADPPSAQSLPEGKGKAEFARICSQCHAITLSTKLRMSEDAWAEIVDDMVSRGTQGTQDEFDRVVKYLGANFGPNNPSGDSKPSAASRINLNKSSEKELSTVLGLSAADAQAIVRYREAAGDFKNWQDLLKVPRVDIKKLEDQKERIEFSTGQVPATDRK